jgi:Domain of unknown function (DUF4249)
MGMGRYICLISVSAISLTGCKKSYAPSITVANLNYLVVEGLINTGSDSTIIKLSRTVNISGKTNSRPELKAVVAVENDQNSNYPIPESGNGRYAAPGLNLDNTRKYRLTIKTSDNKTYVSDFVDVKIPPPIDSILYSTPNDGLHLYLNTHDNNNNTHYYRWDYTETWMFYSQFPSDFKLVNGLPVDRGPNEQIFQCWGTDTSTSVILASTKQLNSDVISNQPIAFIIPSAEKLERRYSILIKQYALTQSGYEYYLNIKKNTEQLGSIFDAQPSSVKGNITCTSNPSEPVIGFISAGTTATKRIFIDNSQLPQARPWIAYTYYDQKGCADDTITLKGTEAIEEGYGGINPPYLPTVLPYFAAGRECVDCTLRGTNKQPDFWK